MVTLERCRAIMQKHGYQYSDEELLKIRDFLYQLAAIEYKAYQRKQYETKSGDHLHEGILRRTG